MLNYDIEHFFQLGELTFLNMSWRRLFKEHFKLERLKKMWINKKVQSELINIINVRKKSNLQRTLLIFYRFTTKLVKLTIMLVTGSNSVIVLNKQCLKVRAETPEIAKIF